MEDLTGSFVDRPRSGTQHTSTPLTGTRICDHTEQRGGVEGGVSLCVRKEEQVGLMNS